MRVSVEHANGLRKDLRKVRGRAHGFLDVTDEPVPTIQAQRPVRVLVEPSSKPAPSRNGKPEYRVPSMAEIVALEPNGFRVASLFSGCGGSSLGYRMAGFKVVYANEFVEAAADTYRANMAAGTWLDQRDIRTVTAADLLECINLRPGELDILDGSPPCASFSTAGKREKHWGKTKAYSDTVQRSDDLFFEFARMVDGIRPRVFVAENVSGLIKGTAKGYFLEILAALKAPGYRVAARLLDAQWLGVPQARQRLIFVGVREDLGLDPVHPKPLRYRYSIRDALPWIWAARAGGEKWSGDRPAPTIQTHGRQHTQSEFVVEAETDIRRFAIGAEWAKMRPGEQSKKYFQLQRPDPNGPCPTLTAGGGALSIASVVHPLEPRRFSIAELRRLCGFPDDFVLTGKYAQQWERLGRAVPPVMMAAIASTIRDEILRKADA